jgi:hypothetical protein
VSHPFGHRQKLSAVLVEVLDDLVASEQVRDALKADTGKRVEFVESRERRALILRSSVCSSRSEPLLLGSSA